MKSGSMSVQVNEASEKSPPSGITLHAKLSFPTREGNSSVWQFLCGNQNMRLDRYTYFPAPPEVSFSFYVLSF
jgi:hypothetical protein